MSVVSDVCVCVVKKKRSEQASKQKHRSLNLCGIIIPKIADEVDPVSLSI